ncbi:MAG: SurA N-terminal domain-containing protein, partial [Deltaproteobacteria bacterium]
VIVLSFVGTIFLVWGKGSDGPGRSLGYAAKVDGKRISLEEFQSSYQRIRNIYQQIYGQALSSDMEKVLGLKKIALDNLIDSRLVTKEAKAMGIKATDDEVAKSIESMQSFQKDGRFDFNLYQQLLKNSRITAKDFEAGQKEELIIKKARQAIKDKVKVSDDEALAEYRKENDKIELEYVAFTPADVIGEVKPTEAELNDYLQKNQAAFKTAEKVAISYILLDPASKAAGLTLTDEEIQTFYQKNIDRWQGKDGILPLNEVKEKVKADAIKQKAAKHAYELAADTLFKNIKSGDLNLIAGQLKLKVQEAPLFTEKTPATALVGETAVIKKALELKQGELGGPVETAKGTYIIKAIERKAAFVPPLAEIKSDVEQKAKEAGSIELARKKAEDAAKLLAGKNSLKTRTTASFGFSLQGNVPSIGVNPELMEAAFKLTPAAPAAATPFKVGNSWYAVRLKNRVEAPRAEFDKAKEQLKQKLLPKRQDEAVEKWTKELRSKVKIEINQVLVSEK